jgi:hypothetical protein
MRGIAGRITPPITGNATDLVAVRVAREAFRWIAVQITLLTMYGTALRTMSQIAL